MEQAQVYKRIALVVEDDAIQRETIVTLLEESDMDVIQCESGEAAEMVLEHVGGCLTTLLTDVSLAGSMDGIELRHCLRSSSLCRSGPDRQHRRGRSSSR